jgi:hypothetical protein
MATGRFTNAAALGQPVTPAAAGGLLGYKTLSPDSGAGILSASYANPGLGYGSLLNSNNNNSGGYGAFGGYGMYGTQWMMNPYQGYLSGAADITRSQGEYAYNIQQARMLRQEARRSALQTRRAMLEEAEWERAHMPDAETIRQKALARELDRALHSPPLEDILSARSLNALLRHLIAQQARGVSGEADPIRPDTLKQINFTVGTHSGNIGLLRNGGKLEWPLALQGDIFKEPREKLSQLMETAYKNVSSGDVPAESTLEDLREYLKQMKKVRDAHLAELSFGQSLEANRYLNHVNDTIRALSDPTVVKHFNNWNASARDVAQLVDFMRKQGLWFAPAAPSQTPAYRSLYNALASYDARMQRAGGASE